MPVTALTSRLEDMCHSHQVKMDKQLKNESETQSFCTAQGVRRVCNSQRPNHDIVLNLPLKEAFSGKKVQIYFWKWKPKLVCKALEWNSRTLSHLCRHGDGPICPRTFGLTVLANTITTLKTSSMASNHYVPQSAEWQAGSDNLRLFPLRLPLMSTSQVEFTGVIHLVANKDNQ